MGDFSTRNATINESSSSALSSEPHTLNLSNEAASPVANDIVRHESNNPSTDAVNFDRSVEANIGNSASHISTLNGSDLVSSTALTGSAFVQHVLNSVNSTPSSAGVNDHLPANLTNVQFDMKKNDDVPTLTDFVVVQKYADIVLDYLSNQYYANELEDELNELLKNAIRMTIVSNIRLSEKGASNNLTDVQVRNQFSFTTAQIHDEALAARTNYNQKAKQYLKVRERATPKLSVGVKHSLKRILQEEINNVCGRNYYAIFETAADVLQNPLYEEIYNEIINKN